MIKKQQKWIALFVALTFIWLLQVSTMPAVAAGTTEQAASAELGPDYYEAVGNKAAPAKKSSILPVVLIGVGVIAVAAVLFLVVLKTNYDLVGTWTVVTVWGSSAPTTFTLVFTGDKKSGTFKEGSITGTYTLDGKDFVWTYPIFNGVFIGKFTDKDSVEGTMTSSLSPYSGTFTATRVATATRIGNSTPCGLPEANE